MSYLKIQCATVGTEWKHTDQVSQLTCLVKSLDLAKYVKMKHTSHKKAHNFLD